MYCGFCCCCFPEEYRIFLYKCVGSNYDEECHPFLEGYLNQLKDEGLIDKLIEYTGYGSFKKEERDLLLSPFSDTTAYGGNSADINPAFFHEVKKREIGRLECLANNCTYFMCLDCDEYYTESELKNCVSDLIKGDYEIGVCKMNMYHRKPTWELMPKDDFSYVPFIYKMNKEMRFILAHPYPVSIDPTRGLAKLRKVKVYERNEIIMHHMSFIRNDITSKTHSVTNKGNYFVGSSERDFVRSFIRWDGDPPIPHPHNIRSKMHQFVKKHKENIFNIDIENECFYCHKKDAKYKCKVCNYAVYCGERCLEAHRANHQRLCEMLK